MPTARVACTYKSLLGKSKSARVDVLQKIAQRTNRRPERLAISPYQTAAFYSRHQAHARTSNSRRQACRSSRRRRARDALAGRDGAVALPASVLSFCWLRVKLVLESNTRCRH
ncbi:hypothetical protein MTO96_010565 [Rhipicephalus appendiculatus]